MIARTLIAALGMALAAGCGGAAERPRDPGAAGPTTRRSAAVTPATSTTTRPTDAAVGPGRPAGWEIVPTANYTATQGAGEVVIRAKGENPTAGCETKFMQSVLRIWPPQFVLIRKRPEIGAAVMTPFDVKTSFKAREPVSTVIVRDGMGRHEVKVEAGQGG
jgi:hypothetical protein